MGQKMTKQEEDVDRENLLNDDEEEDETIEMDFGDGSQLRSLPFSVIPEQRLPFDDPNLHRLIPDCPIKLSVQNNFFKDRKSWYSLEVEHGCFRWPLLKRFRDFFQLHEKLLMYRTYLHFQIPEIKLKKEEGRRFSTIEIKRKNKIPKLPSFPFRPQTISRKTDLVWKMEAMEKYLQSILNIPCFRDYHETLEFLEIGPYSFIRDLGDKGKEAFIKRRSNCGGTHFGMICSKACGFPKKRWLFSKENFIALIDKSRGRLECVMLLDKAFKTKAIKSFWSSDILVIENLNRFLGNLMMVKPFLEDPMKCLDNMKLILQCESRIKATELAQELSFGLDRGGEDFVTRNRHDSFAPPRSLSECKWIVDGATYFDAVATAMEAAKEEIFIANWWLTPEIYLKRPTIHGHYWQLDYLLKRKAREGVKICVLLYKELELALGINSLHTQQKLSKMHPNIQVLRHPEGVKFWAHHEKIVCIDQTYAFIGGIDLCYGRWDDFKHRLTDLGGAEEKLRIERHMSTDPGALEISLLERKASSSSDISVATEEEKESTVEEENEENIEEKDFSIQASQSDREVKQETSEQNLLKVKAEGFKFKGAIRKFQARKRFDSIKRRLSAELLKQERGSIIPSNPDQPADVHRSVQEIALTHLGLERKFRLWYGKDYVNFINKDFENLHQPYSDMIDRNTTPRMPWHDVGIYTQGLVARDIARHFILRWNHAKEEKCPKDNSKPYLMPKCYSTLVDIAPNILQETVGTLYRAECQVLRSLCEWSGGISDVESSIHNAYQTVIREAKEFIYIENQFFISQPLGSSSVFNGIADALFNRILKAHRERQDFRVYVILPLLPAFEGEIGTGSGILIQAITHWNYKSMCRGTSSLYDRLAKKVGDPSKYIGFYGLRTHGILADKAVTELIYVHSKMLIADDRVAIIGSANINDRSLLGRRDSEIAVIVKDTNFLDEPDGVGQFCYSLRTALFREHLGLMQQTDADIDLRYPNSDDFFHNVWNKIAASNTMIYEKVFRCLPTNNVTTFAGLKNYLGDCSIAKVDPDAAQEKLKGCQGYLVQFPLYFLCDERLQPYPSEKEYYLPGSIFT